ncbi:MAG TPA: cytochrome c [Pirellulales bacterium]|jgi:mono/diheme cytochrome c family protein
MNQTPNSSAAANSPEQSPTVEMPRPTAWPIAVGAGVTFIALGAATSSAFCVVGVLLLVISIGGWISQLIPGRGHEAEELADRSSRATEVMPRLGAVEQLKPGVVGYRFQVPEKVQPVSAGIKGGIVGGLLMPIPALAWGVMSGHGIWFPVNLLAGMVIPGLNDVPRDQIVGQLEAFHLWLFLGALVLHICMSVGFGLIGGVLLPTLPQVRGGPLLFGGLILPLLWSGVNHSLMHLVNPLLNDFIDWRWYVASQLVFGIAASMVIIRSEKIAIAPRGSGSDGHGPSIPPGWLGCLAIMCTLLSGCSDNLPGKPQLKDEFVMPQKITDFHDLYARYCAGCHGNNGTLGAGPPLNDELFAALADKDELRSVISQGRSGTLMPAWAKSAGGSLTDEQVASLVEGIHERKWKPAVQSTTPIDVSKAPPLMLAKASTVAPALASASSASANESAEAAGNAEHGAVVFAAACAKCHGAEGKGISLADDPKSKELLYQLNDPAFLALSSNQILRRYVITGRPDLGMPGFADPHGRQADFTPLSSDQVSDVVALLAKWRSEGHALNSD